MSLGRILHLEDDPDWVEHIQSLLGDDYDLYPVSSKEEAGKLFLKMRDEGHKFDLAVIDVSLVLGDARDKQGLEFIKLLEELGVMLGHSIIVLSGYTDMDQNWRVAFRDYGVVDVFDKANFLDERQKLKRLVDKQINALKD